MVNHAITRPSRWAPAAVVSAAVLFGSTGTVRAVSPDDATTLGIGAVRLVLGAFGLAVGALVFRRPLRPLRVSLVLIGGVAVAAYQATFFAATQRTGVTLGTVMALTSGPIVAGILDVAITRRRPTATWLAASTLALVGVVLAVASSGSVRIDTVGIMCGLAAGASYAVYATTVSRLIVGGSDPVASMAATFVVGGALIAPTLLVEPLDWLTTPAGLAVGLHLGLATVAIAYTLYAAGLAHLSAPTAVTLTLAEPITAAVLGRFVLDEPVTTPAWCGFGLVMIGLVLVGRSATAR